MTIVLTAINCYNVKLVARVTDVFTMTKVFALLVIFAAGAWYLMQGHTEKLQNMFENSTTSPGHIALAFYSGLFSYSGWNYLNFVTEELKNPYKYVSLKLKFSRFLQPNFLNRNLPRAIIISIPTVTAIYVITNIAYFSVLTTYEIRSSLAVAVTFGDKMLGMFAFLMPLFVACSTFGSLNGAIFASSRLFFVGARNGHLPACISLINVNFLTPIPSILFMVS